MDEISNARVYKKTSANSILTLYLGSRDLVSRNGVVEPLCGVIYIDPKFMCSQKIYGQLTLTFRYGREDEEVMGLKFCNEAVISLKQIWPRANYNDIPTNPLQNALVERLGNGAYPFNLEVGTLAPPSVQLVPAKRYTGAPIGTSYDIRIFMSDLTDEKFQRRTTIKLGIRLLHKIQSDLRSIQQTNPTYTSLPKCIKHRLSPKQLNFHSTSNSKNVNNTQNDYSLTDTTNNPIEMCTDNNSGVQNSLFSERLETGFKISSFAQTTPAITSGVVNVDTHPLTLSAGENQRLTFMESISRKSTGDIEKCKKTSADSVAISNLVKGPECSIDKPFLWTEGRVSLRASLNKAAYKHGEPILVHINIRNNSRKIIKKIRVFAVQHVDVCMFSNGKFKNVVADISEQHQIRPEDSFNQIYDLIPKKGATKNWIAVETNFVNTVNTSDSLCPANEQTEYKIAASAHRGPAIGEERNVFAIYVSYYVKVKLTLSGMGGEVSLKLPFILGHVDDGTSCETITGTKSTLELYENDKQLEQSTSKNLISVNDDNSTFRLMKDIGNTNPTNFKYPSNFKNEDGIIVKEQKRTSISTIESKTDQQSKHENCQECENGGFFQLLSSIRRKSSCHSEPNNFDKISIADSNAQSPNKRGSNQNINIETLSKSYQEKLFVENLKEVENVGDTQAGDPNDENTVSHINSVTVIVHRSDPDAN